ncbi:hypothetical protein C922_03604 [Plasmodium inui San Antonio 1]|uniref:Uncharacterized protein n=1 Tax=Plasmodium inui San Antonio 1 TaxID=1237626 RepID=W7A2H0_9APIC|nr:hypothetical protein C922_03604 [Plasmodium inui San Antonio 1]EUD65880.1 hypothetical protein C922_03604 [Plasmodium inui San Antonio 1]
MKDRNSRKQVLQEEHSGITLIRNIQELRELYSLIIKECLGSDIECTACEDKLKECSIFPKIVTKGEWSSILNVLQFFIGTEFRIDGSAPCTLMTEIVTCIFSKYKEEEKEIDYIHEDLIKIIPLLRNCSITIYDMYRVQCRTASGA